MQVYAFDVTVSDHDSLKLGITAKRLFAGDADHHRIIVAADDFIDARLLAAQIAHTTLGDIVTGIYCRF